MRNHVIITANDVAQKNALADLIKLNCKLNKFGGAQYLAANLILLDSQ